MRRVGWAASLLILMAAGLAQGPAQRAPTAPRDALSAEASRVIARVDSHYNHLSSLRAKYVEHYTGMGLDREESGMLLLQRPGRMRWTYTQPEGKVFLLDGKFAWSYTPGDAQAQRIAAAKLNDLRSPLRFLLGHTQLRKELEALAVVPEGTGYRISGVPRGMQQTVKELALWVSAAGLIERMRLEEQGGAMTEFAFSEMLENVPVPPGSFRFVAPAGVTVIDGLPPI